MSPKQQQHLQQLREQQDQGQDLSPEQLEEMRKLQLLLEEQQKAIQAMHLQQTEQAQELVRQQKELAEKGESLPPEKQQELQQLQEKQQSRQASPVPQFSQAPPPVQPKQMMKTTKMLCSTFCKLVDHRFMDAITGVSIASKCVTQEERGEGMTYANMAILRLKKIEKVQGALGVNKALVSMYLFSVLGVEGAPNDTILEVGLAGAVTLIIAGLIEFASLAFGRSGSTGDGQAGSSRDLRESRKLRTSRSASIGNIAENMTVAGLV